jgi:peptidoglycan hydrolase CwlO-like protein
MDIIFTGLAAALVTSLIAYLVARRQHSGSISTSDAASLWAESNALRAEYKYRAEKLEAQLEEVNSQLQNVMGELGKLKADSSTMIRKIDELKRIISKLRAENKRLLSLKGVMHETRRT